MEGGVEEARDESASVSAYEAGEAELGRADAVVVAEGAALLAEDHRPQVADAGVVGAHTPAS